MKFSKPLLILALLFPIVAAGQFTRADSLRAMAFDATMIDSIWDAPENEKLTEPEKIEALGEALAKRLRNGPLTVSLANNYHLIALYLGPAYPNLVQPFIDTAILLRTEAGAVTADVAQSHYEKGRGLLLAGDFKNSLFHHEEALKIMDRAINEEGLTPDLAARKIYFLKEAAVAARVNGNFELGRLRLAQIPPLIPDAAYYLRTEFGALATAADIETETGNFERAEQLYSEASKHPFYQEVGVLGRASLLNNQAYAKMLSGAYAAAEPLFVSAAEGFGQAKNKAYEASAVINLLRVKNLRGQPEAVEGLRERAQQILDGFDGATYGDIPGELYTYSAEAASLLNQHERADSLFAKAAAALLQNPDGYGPGRLPRIAGNTIYSQPVLLDMLGKRREAFLRRNQPENALATSRTIDTLLRYNREQLNLTASLGQFISREAKHYAAAIDIALGLYRATGKVVYINEAYQFASGQKSNLLRRYLTGPGLAESLGVPVAVVRKKSELELQVLTTERAFQNAGPEARDLLRDSLLRLNATADELKRRIATDYPAFSQALRGFPAVDPAAAANSLDADRLVIEYFLAADSVYIFTLSKAQGLEVMTVTRPENLTEWIESAVDQGEGATILYDLLVAPVLAGRGGITRLQFIPDGDLWKLPFAALKRGDRFLVQDFAVSFAYAAPLLFDQNLASRARAQNTKYLGYGISYEDLQRSLTNESFRSADLADLRNMGRLPFAVREVSSAASTTGGVARLDTNATLDRFLEESGGAEILHLSMHGLLRPNPMESALVFRRDDGYGLLTMKEVLSGSYPAELTVLSACHTGGGTLQTSEGMQSIGRAFTAAGSRATITSTWAARDEITHDILSDFFVELESGAAKDVAFQRAINTFLNNASPADRAPKKWANLTLTGDIHPLEQPWPLKWILLGLVLILCLGGLLPWRK